MNTIHAIYENGVFRPTTPVDLPEGTVVNIDPNRVSQPAGPSPNQTRIYEPLTYSEHTRDPRLSQRHDQHQERPPIDRPDVGEWS
jgi:predicted DNA-binding antitoxin AbrB/MazE fold protein